MPLSDSLRSLLDTRHIPYSLTKHRPAVRAREMARLEHLPAREVAKTVVVFGDGKFHLLAVPADRYVDLHDVRESLHLKHVRLASEMEIADLFPDCELGAMPPVGLLCGLPVYLDSELAAESIISFNAGTHQETMHIRMDDFLKVVQPKIVSMTFAAGAGFGW